MDQLLDESWLPMSDKVHVALALILAALQHHAHQRCSKREKCKRHHEHSHPDPTLKLLLELGGSEELLHVGPWQWRETFWIVHMRRRVPCFLFSRCIDIVKVRVHS